MGAYDGDGNHVWAMATEAGGVTATTRIGGYYEQIGTASRSYYYLGGKRVAMRDGSDDLWFLLGDHLGSTSVAYRADNGQTTTQRYFAWGEVRPGPGNELPTDYTYTGQQVVESVGLLYYGARWYDAYLNRWIQPDTTVPDPGDPQSINRYTYVRNSPVRNTDPTGHYCPECTMELDWNQVAQAVEALQVDAASVGPAAVVVVGTTAAVGTYAAGTYVATAWAIQDNGPDYPLPMEYVPNAVQPTYGLPGASTVGIDVASQIYLGAASGAIASMADHLGFAFGYGSAGLPGFPDPFNRHDKDKGNSLKGNGRHIRNALEGIRRNLGQMNLRTYLQNQLTAVEFAGITKALSDLVFILKDEGWLYEQFGPELSQEILTLLEEMGYVSQ